MRLSVEVRYRWDTVSVFWILNEVEEVCLSMTRSICFQGRKESRKALSQCSLFLGRGLNPRSCERSAGLLSVTFGDSISLHVFNLTLWFKASAVTLMKSGLLWDITQRRVIILYRRFGTTYPSRLQGSRSPRSRAVPIRLAAITFTDYQSAPTSFPI
jgi:hypothetical protein